MGRRLKRQRNREDRNLLILALVLTGLGIVAVAEASAPQALSSFSDKFYFVKQQAVWATAGIILMFIFSRIHYTFWRKVALPLFIISALLLVAVLVPGIGVKTLGARRWIFLGPLSFQPSELVKLTLAIYLAKMSENNKSPLAYFLPLFLIGALVMFQPDLGTTIIITIIGLSQIFISGVNLLYILAAVILGGIGSFLLIITSSYRRDRLSTFLEQTNDPLGKSYHIRQILLALGSGGLFGVGLGQSRQKYLFLPEAATDSIFAIIAEEVGFLGSFVVILLFAFFVLIGTKIIKNAPDKFSQVLACGLVTWVGAQAFLNIGSMIALVPLTGVPLPFFSYGGSALTMMLVATGILLNISRYAHKDRT